jgi:hypothetical protein
MSDTPTQPIPTPPGSQPPPGYTAPPQPVAPPPGYSAPAPGYQQPGAPAAVPAATGPAAPAVKVSGPVLLSLLAAAGLAAAVFLKEDKVQGWDRYGVWGIFAIVAALATAAPSMAAQFKLTATRAWQVAVAGAVGVAVFWVLLILPSNEKNLSFVATAAMVLAALAAWQAPGRPNPPEGGAR